MIRLILIKLTSNNYKNNIYRLYFNTYLLDINYLNLR